MTPDYTYGHTVTKSMKDYLTKNAGWTTVTNQVSPLGAPDFSSYLLNVANSGADVLINVNWGRDAVLSIQQAQKFGVLDKMKLVVPYQVPFLAPEVGGGLLAGVYSATDYWWTIEDKFPLAKMFNEEFSKKYGYNPEWGAENAYTASRIGRAWSKTPAASIRRTSSSPTKRAKQFRPSSATCTTARKITSSFVLSSSSSGKAAKDMKNKEDFWEVVEIVPGEALMQKPDAFGCNLGDYT